MNYLFYTASELAADSRPTQPLIRWAPGGRVLSTPVRRSGSEVVTLFHLVPRLRMSGSVYSLALTQS